MAMGSEEEAEGMNGRQRKLRGCYDARTFPHFPHVDPCNCRRYERAVHNYTSDSYVEDIFDEFR